MIIANDIPRELAAVVGSECGGAIGDENLAATACHNLPAASDGDVFADDKRAIEFLKALDNHEGLARGKTDFYAKVTIDGEEFRSRVIENDNEIKPFWQFRKDFDPSRTEIPITIQIWDSDGFGRGGDDHIDINSTRARSQSMMVNLTTCLVTGFIPGPIGCPRTDPPCTTTLCSDGNSSDKAQILCTVRVVKCEI